MKYEIGQAVWAEQERHTDLLPRGRYAAVVRLVERHAYPYVIELIDGPKAPDNPHGWWRCTSKTLEPRYVRQPLLYRLVAWHLCPWQPAHLRRPFNQQGYQEL